GPLDNHCSLRIIKNILQPKSIQFSVFDPVQIDMVDFYSTSVLVDQCECRAGDVIHGLNAKSSSQTSSECRFTCAKIAVKKDVCRQRHGFSHASRETKRLFFGLRN